MGACRGSPLLWSIDYVSIKLRAIGTGKDSRVDRWDVDYESLDHQGVKGGVKSFPPLNGVMEMFVS